MTLPPPLVRAYVRMYNAFTAFVLSAGYAWYRRVERGQRGSITWVVGIEEIASMVSHMAHALPGSYSVSLYPHRFFDHEYDHAYTGPTKPRPFERVIRRPLLLARLANRATGIVYIGRRGFLGGASRAPEFAFLRRHGIKICCYFVGNDIRSPLVQEELARTTGVPNLGTRYRLTQPALMSAAYDAVQRRTAAEADRYADVIYTAAVDQSGYLTRPTEPLMYFLPPETFLADKPPRSGGRPVLLHAPSSPVVKGTELVREAIETLRGEGYDFEYVELTGVTHDQVRAQLARADIVLNQFFALTPGIFGAEGLAARCAVLMSADGDVEPDLPPGANSAWCVTRHDQVTDHLRELLEQPQRAAELGRRGYDWALRYLSAEASGARLRSVLDRVAAGSYSGRIGWADASKPSSDA